MDILERLIQGGSQTHRPVGDKAGDAVVACAVDHATRNDQPVAAGGLRGEPVLEQQKLDYEAGLDPGSTLVAAERRDLAI